MYSCMLRMHQLLTLYLTLFRPNGTLFQAKRPNMALKKGNIVSFSYNKISSLGVPLETTISRVRYDISWDDLVNDSSQEPILHASMFNHPPFFMR